MTTVSPRARMGGLFALGCALNVMGFALGGVGHRPVALFLLSGLGCLLLLLGLWLGLRHVRR
ncbi:hypothetical protein [Deinococcus kurensis]|uniref:hypothetical protein n=1 Tax=Deinococcus kurensis TaxID=2662757 RepID=UPI0012D357D5|nr:hypothetical protein [Deinococcus kurensis]